MVEDDKSRDGENAFTLPTRCTPLGTSKFIRNGIRTWFVKADAKPDGSLTLDRDFFVTSSSASATSSAVRRGRRIFGSVPRSVVIPRAESYDCCNLALVRLDRAWCLAWSNPGMGWLFSVALGLQQRSRGCLCSALADRHWPRARHRPGCRAVYIIGAVIPLTGFRSAVRPTRSLSRFGNFGVLDTPHGSVCELVFGIWPPGHGLWQAHMEPGS